jgi:hypothetical protein
MVDFYQEDGHQIVSEIKPFGLFESVRSHLVGNTQVGDTIACMVVICECVCS